MPHRIVFSRIERHPGVEREELGNAAFAYCRAALDIEGVVEAKFYWVHSTGIAIQVETETLEAADLVMRGGTDKLVGTGVQVEDAGRLLTREMWTPPKDASFNYYGRR